MEGEKKRKKNRKKKEKDEKDKKGKNGEDKNHEEKKEHDEKEEIKEKEKKKEKEEIKEQQPIENHSHFAARKKPVLPILPQSSLESSLADVDISTKEKPEKKYEPLAGRKDYDITDKADEEKKYFLGERKEEKKKFDEEERIRSLMPRKIIPEEIKEIPSEFRQSDRTEGIKQAEMIKYDKDDILNWEKRIKYKKKKT